MSTTVSTPASNVNSIDMKITTREGVPMVSSREIANIFDIRHDNVLRNIKPLIDKGCGGLLKFEESKYLNKQGKKQTEYYMNRNAATLLVFQMQGKKAHEFKLAFLNRFEQMERYILSQSKSPQTNEEWAQVRIESKKLRRTLTDVIAYQLIPLARQQGSQNADKLYMSYSTMIIREFVELDGFKKKKNESYADFLDRDGLVMYNRIQGTLAEQMEGWVDSGMHYKDIFQESKKWIRTGASMFGKASINLPRLETVVI